MKKVLVSAEPLPQCLHQVFIDQYSLDGTNTYGTAELGFLAYDLRGDLTLQLLETSIIQIINPETSCSVNPGEVGEIVVMTYNEAYPLIHMGTGDLAMNTDPFPEKRRQRESDHSDRKSGGGS